MAFDLLSKILDVVLLAHRLRCTSPTRQGSMRVLISSQSARATRIPGLWRLLPSALGRSPMDTLAASRKREREEGGRQRERQRNGDVEEEREREYKENK